MVIDFTLITKIGIRAFQGGITGLLFIATPTRVLETKLGLGCMCTGQQQRYGSVGEPWNKNMRGPWPDVSSSVWHFYLPPRSVLSVLKYPHAALRVPCATFDAC